LQGAPCAPECKCKRLMNAVWPQHSTGKIKQGVDIKIRILLMSRAWVAPGMNVLSRLKSGSQGSLGSFGG